MRYENRTFLKCLILKKITKYKNQKKHTFKEYYFYYGLWFHNKNRDFSSIYGVF